MKGEIGMIIYNPLFALLAIRGMKKTDLLKIISSATLAKLSKNENVQTEVIDKICLFLDCQPGDIMKVVSEYKESKNGRTAEYKYKETILLDKNGEPCIGEGGSYTSNSEAMGLIFNNLTEEEIENIFHRNDINTTE